MIEVSKIFIGSSLICSLCPLVNIGSNGIVLNSIIHIWYERTYEDKRPRKNCMKDNFF